MFYYIAYVFKFDVYYKEKLIVNKQIVYENMFKWTIVN